MHTKPLKLLVVEDDPIVRYVHKTLLEGMGHHVSVAETGQQALQLAHYDYDAILLDIGLPDMTGIDVAAAIRQRDCPNRYHRIIALTAFMASEIQYECKRVGIHEILTKPVAPDVLEKALQL